MGGIIDVLGGLVEDSIKIIVYRARQAFGYIVGHPRVCEDGGARGAAYTQSGSQEFLHHGGIHNIRGVQRQINFRSCLVFAIYLVILVDMVKVTISQVMLAAQPQMTL